MAKTQTSRETFEARNEILTQFGHLKPGQAMVIRCGEDRKPAIEPYVPIVASDCYEDLHPIAEIADRASKGRQESSYAMFTHGVECILGMARQLVTRKFQDRIRDVYARHFPNFRKSALRVLLEETDVHTRMVTSIPTSFEARVERVLGVLDALETLVYEDYAARRKAEQESAVAASVLVPGSPARPASEPDVPVRASRADKQDPE